MKKLEGVSIILTGAARGLGLAMAKGLAAAGARLFLVARQESLAKLESLAQELRIANPGLVAFAAACDITDEASTLRLANEAARKLGRIDVLINNAGLGMDRVGSNIANKLRFTDVPVKTWHDIINTNINGTFLATKAILPELLKSAHGRIVNLTTSFSTMQREGFAPYGPSKAAIEAMTAIWAKELKDTKVAVNALLPGGPADTDMILVADAPQRDKLIPPAAMVPPVVWLSSAASDGVTGRRYIAKDWDPTLDDAAAAQKASTPVAW